jgi:hypothetical protein
MEHEPGIGKPIPEAKVREHVWATTLGYTLTAQLSLYYNNLAHYPKGLWATPLGDSRHP